MSRRPLYLPKGIRAFATFNNTPGSGVASSIILSLKQIKWALWKLYPHHPCHLYLQLPILFHIRLHYPDNFFSIFLYKMGADTLYHVQFIIGCGQA